MKNMMKREFGDKSRGMNKRIEEARKKLERSQEECETFPNSEELLEVEQSNMMEFRKVKFQQVLFLKQISKLHWMREADLNTKFFHRVIIGRRARNSIKSMTCQNGQVRVDREGIHEEF